MKLTVLRLRVNLRNFHAKHLESVYQKDGFVMAKTIVLIDRMKRTAPEINVEMRNFYAKPQVLVSQRNNAAMV